MSQKDNLEKDYKACEAIIKKSSKTFYQAFSSLPNIDQRRAIYAVYAFCRYADDIADDAKDINALDALKLELDAFVQEKKANNYIFRALQDVSNKFYPKEFDYQPYYDMLEGQRRDFYHQGYDTLDQLIAYCRLVASSVGEMLVYILAPQGDIKTCYAVAYHLGVAMQITNILRDVGEDYQMQRLYLPKDLMQRFGVTENMIKAQHITPEFKALFDYLSEFAHNEYERAYLDFDVFPIETRKPLLLALRFYQAIIDACKHVNYDVFTKRRFVSNKQKLLLVERVKRELNA